MMDSLCQNDINVLTNEYCGEWLGATLRKLPMWGGADAEINFEWPTQQDWAEMSPDAQLESI